MQNKDDVKSINESVLQKKKKENCSNLDDSLFLRALIFSVFKLQIDLKKAQEIAPDDKG